MRKKLQIAMLLIASAFSSCKKETGMLQIVNPRIELGVIKNHTVSIDQAKKVAILNSIYPEGAKQTFKKIKGTQTSTSSNVQQKQKSGKTIKTTFSLNNGEADPSCYIINYNEGGFAIISGDDRMIPILAYGNDAGPSGLDPARLPHGMDIWINANLRYISELRSGEKQEKEVVSAAWRDFERKSQLSLGNYAKLNSLPTCDEGNLDEEIVETYKDSVYTMPWGQGAGFNDALDLIYMWGGPPVPTCRPLVGCVATAVSIIMRYHESPSSYNWSLMPEYGTSTIQQLMRDNHENTDTDPGCDASYAFYWKSENALEDQGYSHDGFDDYNFLTVVQNIQWGRPVILSGTNNGFGHQWVTDGFKWHIVYKCEEAAEEEPPIEWKNPPAPGHGWVEKQSYMYLRMNWGAGVGSAWCNALVWDGYDDDMRMLTGIHP